MVRNHMVTGNFKIETENFSPATVKINFKRAKAFSLGTENLENPATGNSFPETINFNRKEILIRTEKGNFSPGRKKTIYGLFLICR